MTAQKRYHLLFVLTAAFCLCSILQSGCTSSDNPQDTALPKSGDFTVRVLVNVLDQFYRPMPKTGPFTVILTAQDRRLQKIIPEGDTSCIFDQLPRQPYLATVYKEGYYPSSAGLNYYVVNNGQQGELFTSVVPFSSSDTRIDSIHYTMTKDIPRIQFRIQSNQNIPAGGKRRVILFAGLASNVSSRLGTYVYSADLGFQYAGTAELTTNDLYKDIHASGIPVGSTVYVTARIASGGMRAAVDERTGLSVYYNLEDNTHIVASFIMP